MNVWSIPPNWASVVTETLEWLTDVLAGQSGAEQRRAMRLSPRRYIEYDIACFGSVRTLLDLMMTSGGGSDWLIPLWWDGDSTNALFTAGSPAVGYGNIPLLNAVRASLGVGNGVNKVFQTLGPSGETVNMNVTPTAVYRNDWQGNQLLYPTPRTNLVVSSSGYTQVYWTANTGGVIQGTGTAPTKTAAYAMGPDGVTPATRLTLNMGTVANAGASKGTNRSGITGSNIAVTTGASYTMTAFVKFLDGTDPTTIPTDSNNFIFTANTQVSFGWVPLPNGWWLFTYVGVMTASGTQVRFGFNSSPGFASPNIDMLIAGCMLQATATPGVYIPTTTVAVTQTDYAALSNGQVTTAVAPQNGAALTWSGTGSVTPTPYNEFVTGTQVVLYQDEFNYELHTLQAVSSSTLTFLEVTSRDWPAGTRILPVRQGNLTDQPSMSKITSGVAIGTLKFKMTANNDFTPSFIGGDIYGLYPVLLTHPNERDDIDISWDRNLLELDDTVSVPQRTDTANIGFYKQKHLFMMQGRKEHMDFRGMLYTLKGQLVPIWLPTFADDFTIVGPTNGSTIDVQDTRFRTFGPGTVGRSNIIIWLNDGTRIYSTVTGAALVSPGVERLTVGLSGFPVTLSPANVRRISFLTLVRQEADSIDIQHVTDASGVSEALLSFRSSPEIRNVV